MEGCQSLWEKPIWEVVWPHLDPMDSVCLRTASMEWNEPGKYGPHGDPFFFLIQNEPVRSMSVRPSAPSSMLTSVLLFSPDVLKKCALLALHLIAEEGRDGDGFEVRGLGDEWKMRCQKGPMWEGEGEAWSKDEDASSTASREGNVYNDALHVVGLHGPGYKISLFLDWDLAKVALSCHMALDMLNQEMHEVW